MDDNRRYYSLDALRGSMMMLGIVLHGSQWYLTESPGGLPIPTDPSTHYVFDLLVHFIHSFRMPLFFVLAGFFTSLLLAKRGLQGTYINRGKRILGPLLVSCLTILPLTLLFSVAFVFSARSGTQQLLPTAEQIKIFSAEMNTAGMPTDQPSLGHLWFLYYLLFFYLLIPLCQKFAASTFARSSAFSSMVRSPWLYLVLSGYTIVTLWFFRGGLLFEGFIFIKPHPPSLLYYGSFFVFGYVFHHHRAILQTFVGSLRWSAVLSATLFPLAVYATTAEFHATEVTVPIHGLAVVTNAMLTWSLIYLFMGLFLRFFDQPSAWSLYVSNSSYWVYLVHMPLISLGAWVLLPLPLDAIVKFLMITAFTTLTAFLSYHYLVQSSWIGAGLSGIRLQHKWPWQTLTKPIPKAGKQTT
jgi:peptidoglycan/LPS O-acetylase OafA/YrhL